ncbi:hypothetical protein K439DRAFT_1624993 [Ramaria rubella]|nr:hypothetical protein K439DRAFT_1624993 [Ramaria rubella]
MHNILGHGSFNLLYGTQLKCNTLVDIEAAMLVKGDCALRECALEEDCHSREKFNGVEVLYQSGDWDIWVCRVFGKCICLSQSNIIIAIVFHLGRVQLGLISTFYKVLHRLGQVLASAAYASRGMPQNCVPSLDE